MRRGGENRLDCDRSLLQHFSSGWEALCPPQQPPSTPNKQSQQRLQDGGSVVSPIGNKQAPRSWTSWRHRMPNRWVPPTVAWVHWEISGLQANHNHKNTDPWVTEHLLIFATCHAYIYREEQCSQMYGTKALHFWPMWNLMEMNGLAQSWDSSSLALAVGSATASRRNNTQTSYSPTNTTTTGRWLGVSECHVFLPRWRSASPFEHKRSPPRKNGFEPFFASILQQNRKKKTSNTTTTGRWLGVSECHVFLLRWRNALPFDCKRSFMSGNLPLPPNKTPPTTTKTRVRRYRNDWVPFWWPQTPHQNSDSAFLDFVYVLERDLM